PPAGALPEGGQAPLGRSGDAQGEAGRGRAYRAVTAGSRSSALYRASEADRADGEEALPPDGTPVSAITGSASSARYHRTGSAGSGARKAPPTTVDEGPPLAGRAETKPPAGQMVAAERRSDPAALPASAAPDTRRRLSPLRPIQPARLIPVPAGGRLVEMSP